jgi:hypothetical protein
VEDHVVLRLLLLKLMVMTLLSATD